MARFYTEISKEDFLKKIKNLLVTDDDNEDDGFPWEMPKRLGKDLSKVNFDWENWTSFNSREPFANYPFVGYKELAPGFHTFFMQAGGDWEFPVCFILYWGEGVLRGYIPTAGNAWNITEKCAYGSEDDDDIFMKGAEEVVNGDLMIADILQRITKKL